MADPTVVRVPMIPIARFPRGEGKRVTATIDATPREPRRLVLAPRRVSAAQVRGAAMAALCKAT